MGPLRKKRRPTSAAVRSTGDNPFESRANLHKKHDVFNRKVKGEQRNVARARGQATQRRKQTLLVDFEQHHKANSFKDRRYPLRQQPALACGSRALVVGSPYSCTARWPAG